VKYWKHCLEGTRKAMEDAMELEGLEVEGE
jgi:hypothetical protein